MTKNEAKLRRIRAKCETNLAKALEKKNEARARKALEKRPDIAERLADARAYRERVEAEKRARTEAIRVARAAAALARPGGVERAQARLDAFATRDRIRAEALAYAAANPRTFAAKEKRTASAKARAEAEAKAKRLTAERLATSALD